MRIIAGTLRGHTFESPRSHKTHPMSEKMRGALFNVLGDIEGLKVFDAYGGSGALAFEAVSRAAESALITESDSVVARTISANIKKLALDEKVRLIRANAASYSQNYPHKKFDIVLCDPPYDNIHPTQIMQLGESVAKKGMLVLSKPTGTADIDIEGLELISKKIYGDATLVFYRKI